jgi:hypothetical protein
VTWCVTFAEILFCRSSKSNLPNAHAGKNAGIHIRITDANFTKRFGARLAKLAVLGICLERTQ